MRVVTDDGCLLWGEDAGSGQPLVLCHGGPGLWDMFGELAAALAPSIRVIRWDQRGCGRSTGRGPYTLARFVADLDAVRAHLRLDRIALLGHSWGADLALRYALDHPDRVTSLVYACGTGLGRAWRPEFERNLAARLGDRLPAAKGLDRAAATLLWSAEFADPATATELAERMADPWFPVNAECNAALNAEHRATWREQELVAECRTLDVPALILDGAADIRPRWAVDSLEQALPRVSRVVLPSAGHVPWLEAPGAVRSAVLDHLAAG